MFLESLFTTFLVCRMTKLLDDEVEEDEQFWNQEALKEVCFLFIYYTLVKRWEWVLIVYVKIYRTIRFIDKEVIRYYCRNFRIYVVNLYISLSLLSAGRT